MISQKSVSSIGVRGKGNSKVKNADKRFTERAEVINFEQETVCCFYQLE